MIRRREWADAGRVRVLNVGDEIEMIEGIARVLVDQGAAVPVAVDVIDVAAAVTGAPETKRRAGRA